MPGATLPTSHFRKIQQFKLDYAPIKVTQYESDRTGMRCVIVNQKGPKVDGYFALATEIKDHSGAPHTLEHLVFMGSRSYRYKGLLDKLSTRAYSTTNAWTGTDQTAYTLSTAGWDGFAQILPIYLEHILLPTLTDSACYTEVHHIDGTAHDAGVVYSEMQGVQNNAVELMHQRSKEMLYGPESGFRYETGGLMDALRVLKADRIRAFHKEMYQPKNMCLVITGEVDQVNLLSILDKFEDTVLDAVPPLEAPFKRPWVDSIPTKPLVKSATDTVQFPEEDESVGEIIVSWLGPSCNDAVTSSAMEIMLVYLAGSSISVLENTLVEKEQIASGVYYASELRPEIVYSFTLTAVQNDQLQAADDRLHELLAEVASKPLDLEYMRDCISRFKRQIRSKCEEAGEFFAEAVIVDHLYGDRNGQHLRQMQTMDELNELDAWTNDQWQNLLTTWLVKNPHTTVLGVPSAELSKKLKVADAARLEERKQKLGEAGLEELADRLEQAKAANEVPIPNEVLEKLPVPGTDSIHFISTTSAVAGAARNIKKTPDNPIQQLINQDDHNSQLFLHFEDIPSNFVRIKVTLGTEAVPTALKPLLPLYMMNLFTSPVYIEGQRVEFEEVVTRLERDTIDYGINFEHGNAEMIAISITLEPQFYNKVIGWLRIILFDAIHDKARLHASLTKILADIPDEKRSGKSMLSAVALMERYVPNSAVRASSTLSKALYLKRIRKNLEKDPEKVVSMFTELCASLNRPENIRIKIAAGVRKLERPVASWDSLASRLGHHGRMYPLLKRKQLLSAAGSQPGSYAHIVPIAAIDSSFASLTGAGIDSYAHSDQPALQVAISYLDAVEGPMWTSVRGAGYAYGTWFAHSTDPGILSFSIYRSANAFKAYIAARKQVEGYASGILSFDKFALEGAMSSIVLSMADEQPDMAAAAEASYINQVFKGLPKDWSYQMLAKIRNVKPDEIREVMKKYMVPVFQPETSSLVVTCSKSMSDGLVEQFNNAGFTASVRTLESFYDDYGLKGECADYEESESDADSEEAADTPSSEMDGEEG